MSRINSLFQSPLFYFFLALIIRIGYSILGFPDYWGDSYHNLITSWLTVENDWIYSDHKGRELAWLPLHTYLTSSWMWISSSFSMRSAHIVTIIIGSFGAFYTYLLAKKLCNSKTSQIVGILICILPYHILFSNLNMSEMVTSTILVMLIYYVVIGGNWVMIFILSFLGFLTRYEFFVLAGVLAVILFLFTDRKKISFFLVAGLSFGLVAWSYWIFLKTGDPLNWIIQKKSSLWDANFYDRKGNLIDPLVSLAIAIPVFFFAIIWMVKNWQSYIKSDWKLKQIVGFVLFFHWVSVFIGQLWVSSYPDPKYFIITLPLVIVVVGFLMEEKIEVRKWVLTISLLSLIEIPIFYFLHFTIYPQLAVGSYLKDNDLQGNLWVDFSPTQATSQIAFNKFFSSDQLVPNDQRYAADVDDFLKDQIVSNNIRFIMSYEAPYSWVTFKWVETEDNKPFVWNNLSFQPVYCYDYKSDPNVIDDGIISSIRKRIQSGQHKAILWEIEKLSTISNEGN
jgi:hypothetical protein